MPRTSAPDQPEPVEHDSLEVAVVRLARGAPPRRSGPARGSPSGRIGRRGRTRPSGPRRTRRPRSPRAPRPRRGRGAAGGSCSCARPQRVEQPRPARWRAVAQATASGRSRNDGRREISSSSARSAGTSSRRPWSRYATSACATVSPPGSSRQLLAQEAERARDDRRVAVLERDEPHRRGLRVPAQVDVVDGRVAEVPAAVRALARRQQPDRLAPRRRVIGRQRVHGEEDAGGRLDERPRIARPAPGGAALGVGARSAGAARAGRSRRRAHAARRAGSASASATSAEVVGPSRRPSARRSRRPAAGAPRAMHARAGRRARAPRARSARPPTPRRRSPAGRRRADAAPQSSDERGVEVGCAHQASMVPRERRYPSTSARHRPAGVVRSKV